MRLCLMSELVKRYAGGIDYFTIDAPPGARHEAIRFGFAQLGKPFDFAALTRFLLLMTLGIRHRARVDGRWFCAELVAEAYRRQGVRLVKDPSYYASPRALTEGERVQKRLTIKR